MKTPLFLTAALIGVMVLSGCGHTTTRHAVTAPPPALSVAPAPVVEPDPVLLEPPALSPAHAEVLEMYESGVSEVVLLSHVDQTGEFPSLAPDQIIFLHDMGVPDSVITAMIGKGTLSPADPSVAQEVPVQDGQAVVGTPSVEPSGERPEEPGEVPVTRTVIVEKRPRVTNEVFYSSLSPYGTWFHMDGHGWVWQPTVATVNTHWRPYYDRGSWIYSDVGWYWNSGYSWGWAPFHYGRWALHDHHGWFWVPGDVWGPSWVTFRYTNSFCGWAPLPPRVRVSTGVGITWHGSRVSVGFGFGLSHRHYAFVPREHFCHRYQQRRGLDRAQSRQVFNNSTVINNFIVGDNNTIVNQGISRDHITGGNPEQIRRIALRDVGNARNVSRHSRGSNTIGVYRPSVSESGTTPNPDLIRQQSTRPSYRTVAYRKSEDIATSPVSRPGTANRTSTAITRHSTTVRKGTVGSGRLPATGRTSPIYRSGTYRQGNTSSASTMARKNLTTPYRSGSPTASRLTTPRKAEPRTRSASPAYRGSSTTRSTPSPRPSTSASRSSNPVYRSAPSSRSSNSPGAVRYTTPRQSQSTTRNSSPAYRGSSTTRSTPSPRPSTSASRSSNPVYRSAPPSRSSNSPGAVRYTTPRQSQSTTRNSSPTYRGSSSTARSTPTRQSSPSPSRSSTSSRSTTSRQSSAAPSRSSSPTRSSTSRNSSSPRSTR